jgi:hypothetical protein
MACSLARLFFQPELDKGDSRHQLQIEFRRLYRYAPLKIVYHFGTQHKNQQGYKKRKENH